MSAVTYKDNDWTFSVYWGNIAFNTEVNILDGFCILIIHLS